MLQCNKSYIVTIAVQLFCHGTGAPDFNTYDFKEVTKMALEVHTRVGLAFITAVSVLTFVVSIV